MHVLCKQCVKIRRGPIAVCPGFVTGYHCFLWMRARPAIRPPLPRPLHPSPPAICDVYSREDFAKDGCLTTQPKYPLLWNKWAPALILFGAAVRSCPSPESRSPQFPGRSAASAAVVSGWCPAPPLGGMGTPCAVSTVRGDHVARAEAAPTANRSRQQLTRTRGIVSCSHPNAAPGRWVRGRRVGGGEGGRSRQGRRLRTEEEEECCTEVRTPPPPPPPTRPLARAAARFSRYASSPAQSSYLMGEARQGARRHKQETQKTQPHDGQWHLAPCTIPSSLVPKSPEYINELFRSIEYFVKSCGVAVDFQECNISPETAMR